MGLSLLYPSKNSCASLDNDINLGFASMHAYKVF